MTFTMIVFGVYLLILVALGYFAGKDKSDDPAAVHVGGRKLSVLAASMSASASTESGFVMLGMVGAAYSLGVSALWIVPAGVMGYILLWEFVAPKLRAKSITTDALTLPEFLQKTTGDRSGRLAGMLAAVLSVVFLIAYTAAQLTAAGKALDAQFNIGITAGLFLTAAVIALYTALGGFKASVWTDMFQAAIILIAMIVVPLSAVQLNGGFDELLQRLRQLDPNLMDPFGGATGWSAAVVVAAWLMLGLAYPGQPHSVARIMGIREGAGSSRAALVVSVCWFVCIYTGAVLFGLATRAWYADLPGLAADPERAMPLVTNTVMPGLLAGIVVAGIFSAIASTADSTAITAASVAIRERPGPFKRLKERFALRWLSNIILVVSAIAGLFASGVVFDLVLYAWSGLGASLGPAVLYAVWAKRPRGLAVLAGLISGGFVAFFYQSWTLNLLIGFVLASLAIGAVHGAFALAAGKSRQTSSGA
jgi:sodium/proline symporter